MRKLHYPHPRSFLLILSTATAAESQRLEPQLPARKQAVCGILLSSQFVGVTPYLSLKCLASGRFTEEVPWTVIPGGRPPVSLHSSYSGDGM